VSTVVTARKDADPVISDSYIYRLLLSITDSSIEAAVNDLRFQLLS
jgi:hypothetical protein